MSSNVLSMDGLQSFDSGHRQGKWSRHCCPFCGTAKPIDAAHRSLGLDPRTGFYNCFRCASKGRLGDFVQLKDIDWQAIQRERDEDHRRKQRAVSHLLERLGPIEGKAGAYLDSRGIDPVLAGESGCAYLDDYLSDKNGPSRGAIIFPIRDSTGAICALQGRYLDRAEPKTKTLGNNRVGLFETPGALDSPHICVAESPIDALSLHNLGFPAVSVQGTTLSSRIIEECQKPMVDEKGKLINRIVYICTDNDKAGNAAAAKWRNELLKAGIQSHRYKPEVEGWDWNDQLLAAQ